MKRLVSPPSVGSISPNRPICPLVMARSDVFAGDPRTIVGFEFAGIEQRSSTERGRAQRQEPVVAEAADCRGDDVLWDAVAQEKMQVAGVGEVSDVGEIRSLADFQSVPSLFPKTLSGYGTCPASAKSPMKPA
jgi:hypothetical protein